VAENAKKSYAEYEAKALQNDLETASLLERCSRAGLQKEVSGFVDYIKHCRCRIAIVVDGVF
jgi:hypothetical protein